MYSVLSPNRYTEDWGSFIEKEKSTAVALVLSSRYLSVHRANSAFMSSSTAFLIMMFPFPRRATHIETESVSNNLFQTLFVLY